VRRSLTLEAEPSALARARDAIAGLAGNLPDGQWRDLRIAVSELVSNAMRHGSPQGGTVELVLETSEDRVRVEVYDDGAGFAASTPTRGDEHGGWGLYIVDLVSDRWGVERAPRSCVWLELALHADAADAAVDAA
jgi:anti-sigma regulatory factor (Ser/Thr protein kinase)